MKIQANYPVRAYFEDVGYNYIKGYGKLLFEGELFKEATVFDESGHAEVVTFSGERHKIDKDGNFCWRTKNGGKILPLFFVN